MGTGQEGRAFAGDGNKRSPDFGDGFEVYTHVETNPTAHFKHALFMVCHLHQ